MKSKISLFFLVLIISSCAEEFNVPKLTCNQPNLISNRSVEEVRTSTSSIVSQYKYDDIIEAYVVSSDEEGNFFKTISLQTLATNTTPAVGFSIPVDASNTYVDFRLGNKVYIKMKDQFTDFYFEGMRIGGIYVNNYNQGGVGRVSANDFKKILNASCTIIEEEKLVQQISIADLLHDANINTLVELSDVQFTNDAIGRHYYEASNDVGGATNWSLRDKLGNQVLFRTSSYADFADKIVPDGNGKVRGVLTKFGSDYQLLARYEKDVMLSGNTAVPFFSENFQTVETNTKLNLAGWTNLVEKGTKFWLGTVYAGNGYAEFNTTGTKVVSNIAWLISPKIDMDLYENEVLTFRTAQHHLSVDSSLNSLEVYISKNFDGLNVAKATWIPLTVVLPNQATPWYQFVGSGGVDLSSYTGKINIAFKYIGSGKNLALNGAFQVDDFQIYGNK